MSRLRTIKPGFFLDDELADCSPLARLLFAGLWTIADREGRLEDRPKRIKAETLPYDSCDVNALLEELRAHKFIVRYVADDTPYIAIPTWSKHQNPHVKEGPSTIPAPCKNSARHNADPVEPCSSCLGSCLGSCLVSGDLGLVIVDETPSTGASEATEFAEWWDAYGKVGSKADAQTLYAWWRKHGAEHGELMLAAVRYREHCSASDTKIAHARTFLAKKPNRWREWADGESHGVMDVRASESLNDVLNAGARAFGFTGDEQDDRDTQHHGLGAGTLAGDTPARRCLPAGKLEA